MAERRTRAVCVVDDDESLRRSVRNLLSSVGFRVETFTSAEEFLESTHRADIGCLVLDLRMAGMNGLDGLPDPCYYSDRARRRRGAPAIPRVWRGRVPRKAVP